MTSNATDAQVYLYTGAGGATVPRDVVRVRVDPSVASITAYAFFGRKKLAEVELCEGLVEIGAHSFGFCDHSITKIDTPTSLKRIRDYAFDNSLRCAIRLHDGIESIGEYAFATCIFTNFRIPPLVTVIPGSMLYKCTTMFSLEISDNTRQIGTYAFSYCYCLRNVAFPPNVVFGDNIFGGGSAAEQCDFYQLFGSIEEIMRALSHRFDGLLIHSIVYYQSYHQGVLHNIIAAIQLDAMGNQQDCLGMTPLHILACSSIHDLEVYRLIVQNYPANLITEDRWGALPLLYALWGAAPTEIIQFLLESYQLYYPDHVFNWTIMVETMGRCDTPKDRIENMLSVKKVHFPDLPIDWDHLLEKFARPSKVSGHGAPFQDRMQFLFMCGMSERVDALAFKAWRDHVTHMIHTAAFVYDGDNSAVLHRIRAKVAHFEDEYLRLKEITSILELALWMSRMNASHLQKKIKTDESSMRRQHRMTCGADVVINLVLPYIITVSDEESDSNVETDSYASSDDESSNSM